MYKRFKHSFKTNSNQLLQMKKIFFTAALFVQASLFAQTTTWKNDKMHSKLKFTATHLLVSDVDGLFKNFDVTISTTKPDFSDAVFELSADVSSINTEVDMRDNDLKSANFFDAATYPKITFKSTSIKPDGQNKYKLTGNLTMHGVTKNSNNGSLVSRHNGESYEQKTGCRF